MFITEVTPYNASQWPHQERQHEKHKRHNQRAAAFHLRKEHAGAKRGHIDIGRIVEPLDEGANKRRLNGRAMLAPGFFRILYMRRHGVLDWALGCERRHAPYLNSVALQACETAQPDLAHIFHPAETNHVLRHFHVPMLHSSTSSPLSDALPTPFPATNSNPTARPHGRYSPAPPTDFGRLGECIRERQRGPLVVSTGQQTSLTRV